MKMFNLRPLDNGDTVVEFEDPNGEQIQILVTRGTNTDGNSLEFEMRVHSAGGALGKIKLTSASSGADFSHRTVPVGHQVEDDTCRGTYAAARVSLGQVIPLEGNLITAITNPYPEDD